MDKTEETENSSSEDFQLRIAETPKRKRRRKNKQEISMDSEGMHKLDRTIEETISKCKNLTSETAKKMLCKLVKNDHVLALALLKAEEEDDNEKHDDSQWTDDDDRKSENEMFMTPKLTRLKAKQLNKPLTLPELSLPTQQLDEDVVKFIQEDFKSDEEDDEEYQPDDSDGDVTNTTFSDIDSQPSTPGSSLMNNGESPMKDGEFKVPKTPLTAEEQENIARRTRSKLCLQTTAIETIQSTFIPPDIDLDMYEFDQEHEDDNEWKEFLNEFMMPLTVNVEEDDEADPEYIAEPIPMDKEELRPVRVSKKELNQLISELLEDSCSAMFDNELPTSSKRYNDSSAVKNSKRQSKFTPSKTRNQSPRISSKMYSSNELNTPPHVDESPECSKFNNVENTPEQQIAKNVYYSPVQLQTPQRPGNMTPNLYQSQLVNTTPTFNTPPSNVIYPTSTVFTPSTPLTQVYTTQSYPGSPTTIQMNQPSLIPTYQPAPFYNSPQNVPTVTDRNNVPSILVLNQNQLEFHPLSDTSGISSIMSTGFYYNGLYTLPQFQSVVMQVPTLDLLNNGLKITNPITKQEPQNNESTSIDVDINMNTIDDSKNLIKRESKLKIFDYLNDTDPPTSKDFIETSDTMTVEQKIIFEQQFRMHAQLLCQNFVQIYAHPSWWSNAEIIKTNLFELKDVAGPKNSVHIEKCIKLCNDWESELEEVDSERNKKYMEFLYEEIELDEKCFKEKKPFKGRFHNRMMELVLQSEAIIYPSLLPKIPMRTVKFSKINPPISELSMIALGIEHAYQRLYQELNSLNPIRLREPKLSSIASTIIRNFGSFRTENGMIKLIEKYKSHELMNPIKYYFLHKKAPPMTHEIEQIDLENIKAPTYLCRGLLPKIWESYKFCQERLQFFSYAVDDEANSVTKLENIENEINNENNIAKDIIINQEATRKINSHQKIILNNSIQLEIIGDQIPSINITYLSEKEEICHDKLPILNSNEFSPKRNPLKNWQKSNEEKQKNLTSILKKVTNQQTVDKSSFKKKTVNFILPIEAKERNSSTLSFSDKIKASFGVGRKFQNIIEIFFLNHRKNNLNKNDIHPLVLAIFNRTRDFDIYWRLVECNIMFSKKSKLEGATNGNQNGNGIAAAENIAKTKKQISSEEYSKKINRKLADNRLLIVQNLKNTKSVERDCSYAYNYLERVKKTLMESADEALYCQFMKMLTSFNPDIESVPELYYKMENLLLPNYSDLLDLFLTFLLPEHASEIGKFCEHFILTNMTNLIQKLNYFFRKQPSHMRKIYACLNELSNEQDLTLERLKAKILPLLKGNQLLIDWFIELFDRPSDDVSDEYEKLHLKKTMNDGEADDGYEEMQSQDIIECDNDNFSSCGVKYINGKIMYRSKTLLPAKISFIANDVPIEDERLLSIKDDKAQSTSFCVHEIRKHIQFSDSKKLNEQIDARLVKKKKSSKKFKVCDSQTLHAHAVRLNPIHAQHGEKLNDIQHLLDTNAQNINVNYESPRKQSCKNGKKSGNSPKKTTIMKSPSSSSSDISGNLSTPSPSKTLQTAKKLKVLIDDEDGQQIKKQKVLDLSSEDADAEQIMVQDHSENILATSVEEKVTIIEEKITVIEEKVTVIDNVKSAWTRDEDKMILEEIKNDSSSKEEILNTLMEKLENRDQSQICQRYEFLLNFVTNLTNS